MALYIKAEQQMFRISVKFTAIQKPHRISYIRIFKSKHLSKSPVPTQARSKKYIHPLFGHFCDIKNNAIRRSSTLTNYQANHGKIWSRKDNLTKKLENWKPNRHIGYVRIFSMKTRVFRRYLYPISLKRREK